MARPTVVILGAGFGGLGAARKLRKAPVDVVLVDRHDYHTFHPLLYQVATDLLDPEIVGHPIRELVEAQHNLRFHQATVSDVDLAARQVRFDGMDPLGYDHLVVGLGASVSYFGVAGAPAHAFPLYGLQDAVRIREHLLRQFEAADKDHALVDDGALDVVVVGGGPTGVEMAGALAEMYAEVFARDYPDLPVDRARITLLERGHCLLGPFPEHLREYTKEALEHRGVVVRLGEAVTAVDERRVTLASGEELRAHTLVWAAGVQASPLAASLAGSLGLELVHGRVAVGPDLCLPGHPEVRVVGDIAAITDAKTGAVLPQLGSVALQAGERAGKDIASSVAGEHPKPFRYRNKGTMATIGRGTAVMHLPGGHDMTGRMAWLAWGAVHLALLTGGEHRSAAMVSWTWAALTRDRPARIVLDEDGEPTDGGDETDGASEPDEPDPPGEPGGPTG